MRLVPKTAILRLWRSAVLAIVAGILLTLPSAFGWPLWAITAISFAAAGGIALASEFYIRRETRRIAAREADAYLKRVLDVIPESVFVKDQDGRYLLINQAFAAQRGRAEDHILGQTTLELATSPENAEKLLAEDAAVLAGQSIVREEVSQNPESGQDTYRRTSKIRGLTPENEPIIIGASYDITSLRALESDLRKALARQTRLREHLQRMLDALPTAVFVKDAQHRYVMSNPALNELFGRHPEDIIGRTTAEITSPEFAESVDAEEDALIRGKMPDPKGREETFCDALGRMRQIIVRTSLGQDIEGNPIIIGTISDLTTQRRAEARWQFALESTGDGVWEWNMITYQTYYSPRWKSILGYTENEIGDSLEERNQRIHPQDYDSVAAALQSHLDGHSPIYLAEYRLRCKNGRYIWVLDRGQVVERDDSGRPLWMIATYSDISQRKTFEEELLHHRHHLQELVQAQTADLRQAKSEAEDASAAKTIFLGNMSHELRTPMHAVLSFARLGVDKALNTPPAKLRDYFERILKSGERLLLLLNDLLDLSKLEAGQMDLSLQRVCLRQVTMDAVNEFEAAIASKKLTLDAHLEHNGIVIGDPMRLGQVLRNLISNAIKFSPEGGRIVLALAAIEFKTNFDDGEVSPSIPAMELKIGDEGAGIPADELEAIFEAFFQSKQAKTISGGTGLGLSICREIVKAHGGIIFARSREGHGAEFIVRIPSPLQ